MTRTSQRTSKHVLIFCALLLALASTALAKDATRPAGPAVNPGSINTPGNDVYTHKTGGLQFELPKGWKAEPDGDTMTVTAPGNAVSVVIFIPKEDELDDVTKALDEELGKILKNPKPDGPAKKETFNEMPSYYVSGTSDGGSLSWSVHVLKAKRTVIILTFAAAGAMEKRVESGYVEFLASLKKVG